jgi:hypothetical protein
MALNPLAAIIKAIWGPTYKKREKYMQQNKIREKKE